MNHTTPYESAFHSVPAFTRRLRGPEGAVDFQFNLINCLHCESRQRLAVTAQLAGQSEVYFEMESRYGSWHLVQAPLAPEWVLGYEQLLKVIAMEFE